VQGVGEKWLFSATSRGFGYGYEAVRIRVNVSTSNVHHCLLYVFGIDIKNYREVED
jgi:hypothetical protein